MEAVNESLHPLTTAAESVWMETGLSYSSKDICFAKTLVLCIEATVIIIRLLFSNAKKALKQEDVFLHSTSNTMEGDSDF